jgi:NADH:ubiquinone oxidoreductase subunit C
MHPGMTNNTIPLQGIIYGENDQFYRALTKHDVDEFPIRNAYKKRDIILINAHRP